MTFEVSTLSGESPNKLVVLLHGLGSNGQDLLSLVPYIQKSFPNYHFFSPNGIEKCDMSPYGYQWFSLKNRDPEILRKELERVTPIVLDVIEEKLNELKLTYENLILIGFSQGTMLSLYLTTSLNDKISGVVGYSGAYLPPKVVNNLKTPICLIHGTDDEVVGYSNLKNSKNRLQESGVQVVETHGIKGLTHSIDLEGLNIAVEFLKNKEK